LQEKEMNRRRLLQGLAALPLAGALSGCKERPATGTLKVILHGPFGVIVVKNGKDYRINAFVPSTPPDMQLKHELRFRTPMKPPLGSESDGKRYTFELGKKGLQIADDRPPYLDHSFDDVNLGNIGDWKPERDKYFVFLDLPVPDVITFIPPAEGVLFTSGRTGTMPIEHILQYQMRDSGDVRLGDQPPLSCSDLVNEFQKHWNSSDDHRDQAPPSQRPYMKAEFSRCSNADVAAYFIGVGLPDKTPDETLKDHAIHFFNDVLLKSFPATPRRAKLELRDILGYGPPCEAPPGAKNLPEVAPTVYRDWMPEPHLRRVAAVEDCKIGGVSGCTTGC
jgi:hypothetical protein